MRIGVLGTGTVGRTLAARLADLGHEVMVGTRDPAKSRAKTAPDAFGNPPLSVWLAGNPRVKLGTATEAAGHGELLVNATQGSASLEALETAGEARLNGKVLIDVANPLDFSRGMPPTLFVKDNDSLAEAKKTVAGLLASFGWKDVIDLGDITTARGPEMMLAGWLRLYGALGTPMFNLKVVR